MKLSHIVSCAVALQSLWLIVGCCVDQRTIRYEWTGMEVANIDNSGAAPVESSQASLPSKAYGIRIKLSHRELADARFSPIPAAYATSCPQLYTYITDDSIRTIRIQALPADSNAAPSDVTDDFLSPFYLQSDVTQGFFAIPKLIFQINRAPNMRQVDLLRIRNYEQSQGIRFIITMELNSGTTLADTTSIITLL